MTLQRSQIRIAVNFALDGLLAALAVIGACWLADPAHPMPSPAVLPLAGSAAIWLVGVPFGLARQHWRFTALPDAIAVGASAVFAALLLVLLLVGVGARLPSASFPPLLMITLGLALLAPRVLYRMARSRREVLSDDAETALLLGDGEGAELFLAALSRESHQRYRVIGVLAGSARETGRRIHNVPILGEVSGLAAALDRLAEAGQMPAVLVVASRELVGPALREIMDEAERRGIRAARAPRPTTLS
ncbi:nucleoside-diphosphate sugar epimerase/dehydratase, partial [Acidiphilium sp. PM]